MSESVKEKDSVWSIVKLGLILAVYAAVSCAVLAVVNNVTAPKIAVNKIEKANKAMKEVFEAAEEFVLMEDTEKTSTGSITVGDVYLAKKDGNVIGAAVQVSGPTYDKGTIIVGVDLSGNVRGMRVLELSDSPGFGLKANDPTFKLPNGQTFYGQFSGKNAKNGFKAGDNFDAISGATITSNGIAALMNAGTEKILYEFTKLDLVSQE